MRLTTLAATIAVALLTATVPVGAQSVFTDVPDNHWAAAAVKRLAQAGIIEGYPSPASPETKVAATKTQSPPARAGRLGAKSLVPGRLGTQHPALSTYARRAAQ